MISETKIDSSFLSVQFHLGCATPCRLGRNPNVGGIPLYIKEDIPSKLLNTDLSVEGNKIKEKELAPLQLLKS